MVCCGFVLRGCCEYAGVSRGVVHVALAMALLVGFAGCHLEVNPLSYLRHDKVQVKTGQFVNAWVHILYSCI